MRMSDIAKAIKEMTNAAHDRISGQRFRRRSISHKQSQCLAEPGDHPEVSCANCGFRLPFSSSAYNAIFSSSDSSLTEQNLAAIELKARAYYESISMGGVVPSRHMRTDLTDQAYLASVGCLDLLAEIRRLRTTYEPKQ